MIFELSDYKFLKVSDPQQFANMWPMANFFLDFSDSCPIFLGYVLCVSEFLPGELLSVLAEGDSDRRS